MPLNVTLLVPTGAAIILAVVVVIAVIRWVLP